MQFGSRPASGTPPASLSAITAAGTATFTTAASSAVVMRRTSAAAPLPAAVEALARVDTGGGTGAAASCGRWGTKTVRGLEPTHSMW